MKSGRPPEVYFPSFLFQNPKVFLEECSLSSENSGVGRKTVPRIAVMDGERCKSKDCDSVCIRFCPMVRSRIEAIKIEPGNQKPTIFEGLCSGCGICVRKCPFKAISIVNLPS